MAANLYRAEKALHKIEVAYQKISPELRETFKKDKLTGKFTPLEWYQHLNSIIDFYQQYRGHSKSSENVFRSNVDMHRRKSIISSCFMLIMLITAFYFTFSIIFTISIYYYIALVALSFIIHIAYELSPNVVKETELIKRFKSIKSPSHISYYLDFFNDIVFPLLIILNEEMKATQTLQLTINLESETFQKGQDTLPRNYVTPYNYRWKGTNYCVHKSFSFSGKLHDGTSIRFSFGHRSRERYFEKKKRRIIQSKSVYNTKYTYDFRITIPKQRYQYNTSPEESSQEFPVEYQATEEAHVFCFKQFKTHTGDCSHDRKHLPIILEEILHPIKEIYKSVTPK